MKTWNYSYFCISELSHGFNLHFYLNTNIEHFSFFLSIQPVPDKAKPSPKPLSLITFFFSGNKSKTGNPLAVQWLEFSAFTVGAQV